MAANTKGKLDGFLAAFDTAIDAEDYTTAKKALLKAQVSHAAMANTEFASYRSGDLARSWDLLEKMSQTTNYLNVRGFAGLRNKRRST